MKKHAPKKKWGRAVNRKLFKSQHKFKSPHKSFLGAWDVLNIQPDTITLIFKYNQLDDALTTFNQYIKIEDRIELNQSYMHCI